MPTIPTYFPRLPSAIAGLRELASDWVDRRQLEEALGVSKTVAWRLLRHCGATPGPGGALVARREDLVRRLERLTKDGGPAERAIERHGRLEGLLAGLRPTLVAKLTPVARPDQALRILQTRFSQLPANVCLTPRSLRIDFFGTEDFLMAFGAMVYALHNDYEAIREFIESADAN